MSCKKSADRLASGEILVRGQKVTIRSPGDAISHGIGLVPEDRKRQGALLEMSIKFNTVYCALDRVSNGFFVDRSRENEATADLAAALQIKTPSLDQLVRNLSGGNQQKVVLAKWLFTQCNILILDEPTRGIDVGAKQEIYALIRKLSADGVAVLMISSEMPELVGLADRILVLRSGAVTGELSRSHFNQETILRLASGLVSKDFAA